MLIELVDTMEFQGEELRRFNYRLLIDDQLGLDSVTNDHVYAWTPSSGSYLEKVGNRFQSPIGENTICIAGPHTQHFPLLLTCYSDDQMLENGSSPCSLYLSTEALRNPANTKIYLYNQGLRVENTPNSTLHIYDIHGKQLLQEHISSDNQSFDVRYLPNGILMVVVETETDRLTKKVVKTSY